MSLEERLSLRYFAEELVGLELQPGQERLVSLIDSDFERLRTVVIRKGRRSGMTACAALVAAWCGTVLAPRFRAHLLPGEEFAITLVATSREQAGVALGFVKRFLAASPILAEQVLAETTDSLTLSGGCLIEAVPCSARSSRGRANGLVILDEAAHFTDTLGNSSLPAVLDALSPPLAQFGPLGLLLAISTPLDASGPFFELEQQAASGQFQDMIALHLPTLEAMPQLAAEAERERARNPRRFAREWLGEYTTGEEAFPLEAYDACVDPGYRPPIADPDRVAVFALDGAVSRDSMALVGVDADWNLIYARAWHPPKGGKIDHREVLAELLDLARRFTIAVVAYDPSQIHGLATDGLEAGLPMLEVSQAAGRAGGTMARHAAALVESLHERRLRLYPDAELRQHVARSRFSARTGADRLVKAKSVDKIDLAVALAMAVGVRAELERQGLRNFEEVEYEIVTVAELAREYQPTPWTDDYHPGPEDHGGEFLLSSLEWDTGWSLGRGKQPADPAPLSKLTVAVRSRVLHEPNATASGRRPAAAFRLTRTADTGAQRRPNRDRRSVATLAAPGDALDPKAFHQHSCAANLPRFLERCRHLERAERAALRDRGGSCGTGCGSGTITGPGGSLGTGSGSGTITGPGGSLGTGSGSGTSGGWGSVGGIGTASVGRPSSCAWSIRSRIRS